MRSVITYFNDGSKKEKRDDGLETWFDANGNIHRSNGPAVTFTYTNIDTNPKSKTYLERIIYVDSTWYWKGVKVNAKSQEEFQNMIRFIAFI